MRKFALALLLCVVLPIGTTDRMLATVTLEASALTPVTVESSVSDIGPEYLYRYVLRNNSRAPHCVALYNQLGDSWLTNRITEKPSDVAGGQICINLDPWQEKVFKVSSGRLAVVLKRVLVLDIIDSPDRERADLLSVVLVTHLLVPRN